MLSRRHTFFIFLVAALLLVAASALTPEAAYAQCPLCRAGLMNGGERTARTMNFAILVLLIPPVSIFCSFFVVAYKKIKNDDKGEVEQHRER
jgi:hypothetical protein